MFCSQKKISTVVVKPVHQSGLKSPILEIFLKQKQAKKVIETAANQVIQVILCCKRNVVGNF